MGQAFSKRVVPLLDRLRAKQEKALLEDALQEIERRKAEAVVAQTADSSKMAKIRGAGPINPNVAKNVYIDPNARLGGFQRGQQYQVLSEDDLTKQIASGDIGKEEEMPPDLIKFLNEVGPATKVENLEFSNDLSKRASSGTAATPGARTGGSSNKSRAPRVERLMAQSETDTLPGGGSVSTGQASVSNVMKDSTNEEDDEEQDDRLTDEELSQILLRMHNLPFNTEGTQSNHSKILSPASAVQDALRNVGIPIIVRDKDVRDDDQDPNATKYQAGWYHQMDELKQFGPQVYPSPYLSEEDQAQFATFDDGGADSTDSDKIAEEILNTTTHGPRSVLPQS